MTSNTASERHNLPGLLAMRWYAALSIVLVHLIALPKLRLPEYLTFVPNSFGNGVPLFYIVSAFGLFVGYHSKLQTRDQLAEYYRRRFFRIAPLFYFVMIAYIPFCWLMWGTTIPLSQFISSGLFVFNFIPEHASGFVMASWSIGVEMAFYAILPVLIFALTTLTRAAAFFIGSAFVSAMWLKGFEGTTGAMATFGNYSLVGYLVFFAAGICAFWAWEHLRKLGPLVGACILCASVLAIVGLTALPNEASALATSVMPENARGGIKVMWAISLASAVLGISLYAPPVLVGPFVRLMGEASFSIYLWHPVVIVMMDRIGIYAWLYAHLNGTSNPFFASLLLTLAVLLPLSIASYRLIERPGMKMASRFNNRQPVLSSAQT